MSRNQKIKENITCDVDIFKTGFPAKLFVVESVKPNLLNLIILIRISKLFFPVESSFYN